MQLSPLNNIIPSWDSPTLQDFDVTDVQDGQRLKGSNRQYVRFYKKVFKEVVTLEAKINEKTGTSTPVKVGVKDVERLMVNIVTPGDKNVVDAPAEDFHKREHWAHYKAFMDGRTAPIGTSLDECNYVSPSVATDLRYYGCHTEEQLADASDILCAQIANGFELREFARARCKANIQEGTKKEVQVLRADLERSHAETAALKAEMEELRRLIRAPSAIEETLQSEVPKAKRKYTKRVKTQNEETL